MSHISSGYIESENFELDQIRVDEITSGLPAGMRTCAPLSNRLVASSLVEKQSRFAAKSSCKSTPNRKANCLHVHALADQRRARRAKRADDKIFAARMQALQNREVNTQRSLRRRPWRAMPCRHHVNNLAMAVADRLYVHGTTNGKFRLSPTYGSAETMLRKRKGGQAERQTYG